MSVLGGQFLAEAGVDTLHELVQLAPSVHFDTSPCCSAVFIRGFGTSSNITAFDPAVGLALDELSLNQSIFLSDPLFDVERFEILRGPQGVLFGKNTTAGLFNVTTRAPTDELEGALSLRAGGLGEKRFEGAIGGPVGDVARVRLAAVASSWADDVENTKRDLDGPDLEQRAVRARLAFEPVPDLDVLVTAEAAASDARDLPQQAHRLSEPAVDFLRRFDPRFEDDGFDHRSSQDFPTRVDRDTHRLQAKLTYHAGDFGPLEETEVVAVGGYARLDLDVPRDFDFTPADLLREPRFLADYEQRSAELRLTATFSPAWLPGAIDLLGGFFVFDSDLVTDAIVFAGDDLDDWLVSAPGFEFVTGMPAPGGLGFPSAAAAAAALGVTLPEVPNALAGDGLRIFSDQGATSEAVFGQASWRPNDEWIVSAGARVTFERKSARLRNECYRAGLVCIAGGAEAFALDLERDDTDVSPRVAVQWLPLDDLSLFAVRATGFKSGGFNNQSSVPRDVEVDPESAVSWEVGAKGSLFDGSLSYGLAFFHMDVEDLQLQDLVGTLVTVRNAASARSLGVELDFDWRTPWERLGVQGAAAYTDARFDDYPNAVATVSSGAARQDLSGRRLPFIPEWHVNASPTLRVPLDGALAIVPRDLELTIALDALFETNLYLDGDLDPVARQDAYALLHGRIGLGLAGGAWALTIRGTNLTDAEAGQLVSDLPIFFPGGYFATQEPQRNWTLEVAVRF